MNVPKIIMHRRLFQIFILAIVLIAGAAPGSFAQEPSTRLEPSELPDNWWSSLVSKKEQTPQAIDVLIKDAEESIRRLPEDKQENAQTLLKSIQQNFQTYLKVINQPPPKPTSPPPLQATYSVEKLIELNAQLVKEAIELEARKDERKDLKAQADSLQKDLDSVRLNFFSAPKRSEEKLIYGLQILALTPALESAKAKLALFDKSLEIKTNHLKYLREEIRTAKERVTSKQGNIQELLQKREEAMQSWEEAKELKNNITTSLIGKYTTEQTEEAKILNQNLLLQQLIADLKEVQAQNKFILSDLVFTLSEILVEPNKLDLESLPISLNDWSKLLDSFKSKISDWESQTRKIVEQDVQLLSLDEQKTGTKTAKADLLRKNIELGQKNILSMQVLKKEIEESQFLFTVLEEKSGYLQGQSIRWFRYTLDFIHNVFSKLLEELNTTLFYIGAHPATLLTILQFLFIMVATWWLAKFVTATLNAFVQSRKGIRKAVIYRINTLIRYLILFLGFLLALTSIGFDFSNLLIIAGALGIGLGFGLQNIFNNFLSGIIILFQSHLKVGDFIVLENGISGEIREINVRSTVLTTNDGAEVIVPNADIVSSKIINWTLRDPYRRIHVPFSVSYDSNPDEVAKIVVEAAKKVPCTLTKIGVRDPQVFLIKFGDHALDMELVVWVDEKWSRREIKARSMYLWEIEKVFKKHGIKIPYPQRELYFKP